jgi:hypothetical protein
MLAASTRTHGKQSRSLSLEREVIQQLEETKGSDSTSQRANQLLRLALEAERYARLENEAQQFYGSINDREETRAFRSGSMKSWGRE